jgi:hypothetical protein
MTYFISGHRNITSEEFVEHYLPQIFNALKNKNSKFVIGDYDGVDSIAQQLLINKTKNVTVYHMFDKPMNNNGNWKTKGGYTDDIDRDSAMTRESDEDIAWIRKPGDLSGTEQNIIRRNEYKNKI